MDGGAGYRRLFRLRGDPAGGDGAAAAGPDEGAPLFFEWAPTGAKVFAKDRPESELSPGGDVAAVRAGRVSISPLDPAFRSPLSAAAAAALSAAPGQ